MSASHQQLHLPSGRVVRLEEVGSKDQSPAHARSGLFADAFVLFKERVRLTDSRGQPLSIGTLRLDDFHALRAIAARLGWLDESPITIRCNNCEQSFEARPSSTLELGPFLDGELEDPELDAPFPFGDPLPIPEMEIAGTTAKTAVFVERTVDEASAFWQALARGEGGLDPAAVVAMGLHAIGSEERPEALSDALSKATDEALDIIFGLFDEAYYSQRLLAPVRCPECDAVDYVEAPLEREFPGGEATYEAESEEAFVDEAAFEAKVRAIADEVYRKRGVTTAVGLVVDTDIPAVDDGGVPLLGSYVPGGADPITNIEHRPEVTLYYRSFRAMWAEEGAYDLDAELHETIDHELEHHLHYLAGHDPLDDEERATIDEEWARLIGRREAVRRARVGFIDEVGQFFRHTWPLWVLVALLTVVATLTGR